MIPVALYFAPVDSHGGLLNWLFGGGIGTNIGASVLWGFAAGFIGYLVARKIKAAWQRLHDKLDSHHHAITKLHEKLDRLGGES